MKKSGFVYVLSVLLMFSIGISSMPLSLLHHHEHENECDIASNIPEKFKKEKNQYPKHYHSFEKECFLCFETHFSKANNHNSISKKIINYKLFEFVVCDSKIQQTFIVELKGRGPPSVKLNIV